MRSVLIACAAIVCSVTTAFACWQTDRPPALVTSNSLNLRVTDNDKAKKGAKFELHRATTFDREEARRTGAFEKAILKSVTTDSQGQLSFGEVKPGRYWIVPEGGSLSYSIAVEVTAANNRDAKRIWLRYYDDGCLDITVENAT